MRLFSPHISPKVIAPVCRQLATSYEAGLPILKTLELVAQNTRDKETQHILREMGDRVRNGATLGEAARAYRRQLPLYFIEMLDAGDKSGKLAAMLRDLADYYEDQTEMRRKIAGALIYPGIQAAAAWFLGTFALRLVSSIDFTGRSAFSMSTYLASYLRFQTVAMVVFMLLIVTAGVMSRAGVLQWVWSAAANALWPINTVVRKLALARFFRSMSLLVGSGMHMPHCISNAAAITANPHIQRDLMRAAPLVVNGASLVDAFSICGTLTPMARQMLAVGEQSGNLEMALAKVAQYHLEEADFAIRTAAKVLGVVILLGLGALVGYIYISFFMTYYGRMLDSIG